MVVAARGGAVVLLAAVGAVPVLASRWRGAERVLEAASAVVAESASGITAGGAVVVADVVAAGPAVGLLTACPMPIASTAHPPTATDAMLADASRPHLM